MRVQSEFEILQVYNNTDVERRIVVAQTLKELNKEINIYGFRLKCYGTNVKGASIWKKKSVCSINVICHWQSITYTCEKTAKQDAERNSSE